MEYVCRKWVIKVKVWVVKLVNLIKLKNFIFFKFLEVFRCVCVCEYIYGGYVFDCYVDSLLIFWSFNFWVRR